jgi:hypothetical protein
MRDISGEMGDTADMVEWAETTNTICSSRKSLNRSFGGGAMTLAEYFAEIFHLIQASLGSIDLCTNATCLPREPLLIVQCNVTPVQLLREENNKQ